MAGEDGKLVITGDASGLNKEIKGAAEETKKRTKEIVDSISQISPAFANLSKSAQNSTVKAVSSLQRLEAETKRINAMTSRESEKQIGKALVEESRYGGKLRVVNAQGNNAQNRAASQQHTNFLFEQGRRRTANLRSELQTQRKLETESRAQQRQEAQRDVSQINNIMRRARLAPESTRTAVSGAITGTGPSMIRQMMTGGGQMTSLQALERQLRGAVGTEGAAFLTGIPGVARPASLGGRDTEAIKNAKELLKIKREQLAVENQLYKADRFRAEFDREQVADADKLRKELDKAAQSAVRRAGGGGAGIQKEVHDLLFGGDASFRRQQMVAQGSSPEDAITSVLGAKFGLGGASFLATGSGKRPPLFGGKGAGGGSGGIGGILRRLLGGGGGGVAGSIAGGLLSGIGVGVGGYALANAGQAVIDATKQATAYQRQYVAASQLAGGQQQLNALLAEYNKESGGAVSKTDALAATTRLLATGFASNVAQIGRFTRASRGASIALGRPEEEVTQDIQLAISNTSVKRLDQIGLGIKEVNDRIQELRKNNKGWQRETAFGEAVLQLLDEKYGKLSKSLEGQKTGLEQLASAWDDLTLAMGKNAQSPVNSVAKFLAGAVNSATAGSDAGQLRLQNNANRLNTLGAGLDARGGGSPFERFLFTLGSDPAHPGRGLDAQGRAQAAIEAGTFRFPDRGDSGYSSGSYVAKPRFSGDGQREAVNSANQQMMALEKSFNQQRLSENHNFNEQMAASERNFHKSMLREEEDFGRSRARSERDNAKQLRRTAEDNTERDAGFVKDRDKTITKANEDYNKRIQDINDQYNDEREKAEKQHRLTMLQAAGQLDAIALLNERMQWKQENEDRKKNHDKQLQDARQQLDDQTKQANDAYNDRIEEAHKADQKAADRQKEDRAQQLADEDVDRGIQKARAIQDHNDELAEMTRVHNDKMTQIQNEYNDQKNALTDAITESLAAVGIYIDGYTKYVEDKNKKIDEWFDKFTANVEKIVAQKMMTPDNKNYPTPNGIPRYAEGGYVPKTGLALLHAGEYVMPASVVQGGGSSSSSKLVQIHAGAFQVYTTPGMETAVARQIEEVVIKLLEAA